MLSSYFLFHRDTFCEVMLVFLATLSEGFHCFSYVFKFHLNVMKKRAFLVGSFYKEYTV